jgi:4-hydroxy-tetrahydrodipicolinate synthase
MKNLFSGTGVALVTPFKADYTIDFQGIETMVNHIISNDVDYIVALGTTAETPTLSFSERNQILSVIMEVVKERLPVVVGIGCNNPLEVNEQIQLFDLKKASAVLSVTPYYNRPQQRGLIGHYKAIAEKSPLPLILYNVPARTGVNMEAETTLQIAKEIPKAIGIKEASGNMAQIMQIVRHCPKDFLVISGDDALTLPLLACGADGVISTTANAFPKEFSTMVKLAQAGDFDNAKTIHYRLLDCMTACFKEGSPSGVKAFLQEKQLIEDHVRLPLVKVSEETRSWIAELVAQ